MTRRRNHPAPGDRTARILPCSKPSPLTRDRTTTAAAYRLEVLVARHAGKLARRGSAEACAFALRALRATLTVKAIDGVMP